MKIRIIADSSGDLREIDGVDFVSVPLSISTDERTFVDDENIELDDMLGYLASYRGRSYTACPGIEAWMKSYEGADEIYVVVLSSGISGTYNAAMSAARIFRESNPQVKIHVFDTLSAGPEVRMLALKIAEFTEKGMKFEEVCSEAEDYLQHTRVFFALESFHNFAQNGRVSKVAAAAAGVLNIRILATASTVGQIDIIAKCRGEKGSISGFMKCMDNAGYDGGRVLISHCRNLGLSRKIEDAIHEKFPQAEIVISETRGLCSYYAENGGLLLSCECSKRYC